MTPSETAWIAEIEVSGPVLAKIRSKHGVTLDEVKEATLCGAADAVVWDRHPEKGLRLLARGTTTDGKLLKVVLYPDDVDSGRFYLATAFQDTR